MTTQAGIIKKADRKNLKVLNRQQLLDLFNRQVKLVEKPKHKALILWLYLTGSRIEEVVGMKDRKDKEKKWLIEPVKRSQVTFIVDEDGRRVMLIDGLIILKRKADGMGRPTRTLNLPVNPESEFIQPLLAYLDTRDSNDYLWDYHPGYVWDLMKTYFGNNWFPHFFRHTRATRLATDYGFNSLELATFMGWKDPRMASRYAHLATQDLAKKIK